jgi:nicotinamidase-related amidase
LAKSEDLHGSAPDKSPTGVAPLDVNNHSEHEDGDALLADALRAAPHIASLRDRAHGAGVPVVYANDNFGRWTSDQPAIIERCRNSPGREVVEQVAPADGDYFVMKPKHSAFYQTSLPILLEHLEASTLVIAGWTTDICVLFSAIDAYMRGFDVIIPSDGVAAVRQEHTAHALDYAARVLKALVLPTDEIDFDDFNAASGGDDRDRR